MSAMSGRPLNRKLKPCPCSLSTKIKRKRRRIMDGSVKAAKIRSPPWTKHNPEI